MQQLLLFTPVRVLPALHVVVVVVVCGTGAYCVCGLGWDEMMSSPMEGNNGLGHEGMRQA